MSLHHSRLLLALSFVAIAATPSAQQPQRDAPARSATGTAAIVGTIVTDDSTSRPLRRALVNLNNTDAFAFRQAATDDDGHFAFADLPAGHYSIYATKPAYAQAYYRARQSWLGPSSPITLADGERFTADMRMARGAVITGTILDTSGKPQTNVRVMAMRFRMVAGERQPEPAAGGNLLANTDDRGMYRLFGLPPGEYAVGASVFGTPDTRQIGQAEVQWAQQQIRGGQVSVGTTPSVGAPPAPGPSMGYAPVFFPGTADPASSTVITLSMGEERTGVDFPLSWVTTSRVAGTVTGTDGQPAAGTTINLVAKRSIPLLTSLVPTLSRTDAAGKFSLTGVLPGDYTLLARATAGGPALAPPAGRTGGPPAPRPITWAQQDLSINGSDVTGLSLRLQAGLTISGRLAFDGTTPQPSDLTRVSVSLGPAPGVTAAVLITSGQVAADGTFSFAGATPGRYRLNVNVPNALNGLAAPGSTPTWSVKSIVANGVDTLDAGLEVSSTDVTGVVVTFTDRPTDLSGRLVDANGHPAPGYWVVAFSADRTFWTPLSRRTRQARPDAEGKYHFTALPPGDYFLIALTDIDQADMADASFLDQLARASYKITLAEGEKRTQDLKLSGGG